MSGDRDDDDPAADEGPQERVGAAPQADGQRREESAADRPPGLQSVAGRLAKLRAARRTKPVDDAGAGADPEAAGVPPAQAEAAPEMTEALPPQRAVVPVGQVPPGPPPGPPPRGPARPRSAGARPAGVAAAAAARPPARAAAAAASAPVQKALPKPAAVPAQVPLSPPAPRKSRRSGWLEGRSRRMSSSRAAILSMTSQEAPLAEQSDEPDMLLVLQNVVMRVVGLLWLAAAVVLWGRIVGYLPTDLAQSWHTLDGPWVPALMSAVLAPIIAVGLWLTSSWGAVIWAAAVLLALVAAFFTAQTMPFGSVWLVPNLVGLVLVGGLAALRAWRDREVDD